MEAYTPRADAELEALAQDIVGGQVWSSYNGPDAHESFMVIWLMGEDGRAWAIENEITFAYEYMREAGPVSVNGRPSFMSVKFLNRADALKLHERIQEIIRIRDDRLKAAAS